MSKKTNSLIFMVIATIVNVVILLVFCVVGLLLLNALAGAFPESPLIPALIILVFSFLVEGTEGARRTDR